MIFHSITLLHHHLVLVIIQPILAIAPAIGERITKAVTLRVKATERTTALSFPASSKASKANPNQVKASPNLLFAVYLIFAIFSNSRYDE